jgi:hypothetical protein
VPITALVSFVAALNVAPASLWIVPTSMTTPPLTQFNEPPLAMARPPLYVCVWSVWPGTPNIVAPLKADMRLPLSAPLVKFAAPLTVAVPTPPTVPLVWAKDIATADPASTASVTPAAESVNGHTVIH